MMVSMSENQIQDFVTYGRTFEQYKWYKPILTFIITGIIYIILNVILVFIFMGIFGMNFFQGLSLGYEGMNTPNAANFFGFLSLVILIPSIYLASRIIKDRPFSSYASSRGGWDWKIYFKCMAIVFVLYIISTILQLIIFGSSNGQNNLNVLFIAFLIVVPLQCIGEEFLFRGLIMQTIGSWINIPIVAVIIQSIIFGLLHTYNSIGIITVIAGGIIMGIIAWKSNGLEASSALHSINNIFTVSLGVSGLILTTSAISSIDLIWSIILEGICGALILYIGNKYDWFTKDTN